jgi:hypothetical protein
MTRTTNLTRGFALLGMLLGSGCAPAYHSYADCYIDCNYCPPPPLAYTHYDGCVCHACVASPYLYGAEVDNVEPPADEEA